jgi:trans-aconitate methyltransferase
MNSTDFTGISVRYDQDSLVQKSASEKLISLLDIRSNDDVLDLGCGTGSITRRIRSLTEGKVAGIDPSEGMIREAKEKQAGMDIDFGVNAAEGFVSQEAFSVIFCNSAFQWFRDPERALGNCYAALKRGGRMGIQAPATQTYCPNFIQAIDDVGRDSRTSHAFAGFRSPWLFLETADAYAELFRKSGFDVTFATLENLKSSHTPDKAMAIFESGAAAGYLNRAYYVSSVDERYAATFREIVRASFHRQAGQDGKVELTFNRVYLVARKDRNEQDKRN